MADEQKTEEATPRRKLKAREQGQVARSHELMASLAIMTAIMMLSSEGARFPGQWRALLSRSLDQAVRSDVESQSTVIAWTGVTLWEAVGLVMLLSWTAALAGAIMQGGFVFAPEALQPKWSRMDPAERVKQLFSVVALSRLLKSLVPGAIIVWLMISSLSSLWGNVLGAARLSLAGLSGFAFAMAYAVAWKSALALLAWSLADYMLERYRMSQQLRMSKQELKDEYKQSEGNPAIKNRVRRLRRQVHRKRMLEAVKRAAVVITNPDEFAIALEYRMDMAAPVVVAKGRNIFAQQIKQVALWNGIPMIENRPLAHALYRAVEVGQSIPSKLYVVIAAILAAVYRAQQTAAAAQPPSSAWPSARPSTARQLPESVPVGAAQERA